MKYFNRIALIVSALMFVTITKANNSAGNDSISIEGRWDMVLHMGDKTYPSWLGVEHSGLHTLVGQYVGAGGSARPIAEIKYAGGKLSFTIPPQWETGSDLVFEGIAITKDSLSGTVVTAAGNTVQWTAVRAPSLVRTAAPKWGKPITLFNGTDLKGWHAQSGENQWMVEKGVLKSPHSGANLMTDQSFTDFKLHIEFRYPEESNSGVYLRGRYEVQVQDDKGKEPSRVLFSAIYGFIEPTEMTAKAPGEWQSYDITLVGRMVTVVANGVTVICNRPIPGITGGAIDSKEDEPGPLLIQGDHGPIEYRNIILTPAVN